MKSRGLGDSVEKFKATGKPCGCSQRRDSLNRMFPYNK